MLMLPKDCKERREQVVSARRQGQLDSHLQPILPKEVIPPYSDDLFVKPQFSGSSILTNQ